MNLTRIDHRFHWTLEEGEHVSMSYEDRGQHRSAEHEKPKLTKEQPATEHTGGETPAYTGQYRISNASQC